jgi:hypothetical protein
LRPGKKHRKVKGTGAQIYEQGRATRYSTVYFMKTMQYLFHKLVGTLNDADPDPDFDPTFHSDADLNPYPDLTPSITSVGK